MTVLSRLRGKVGRFAAARGRPQDEPTRAFRPTSTIHLGTPEVSIDPFPHYEALRRSGDVHFLPNHNFWLVLGYDAVKWAFAQPEIFSNKCYDQIDSVLLAADPPQHTAIRRIVSRYFSGEVLNRLTASAQRISESLIKPELDVVSEYAGPVARGVAAELIGFDQPCVDEIAGLSELPFTALTQALDDLAPRSSLYQPLVDDEEGLIGPAEARSLIRLLWLAASQTTERLIARCVLRLLQHENIRHDVEADAELLPPFIEEVLRLHPAEHMIPRRTTRPVTLAGVPIPANAWIQLCISAANRDPAHFDDPEALRLDRPAKRHIAFGSGVHLCVGAPLTRRVTLAALQTLLRRSSDLRALQQLDSISYFRTVSALSPEQLVIGL